MIVNYGAQSRWVCLFHDKMFYGITLKTRHKSHRKFMSIIRNDPRSIQKVLFRCTKEKMKTLVKYSSVRRVIADFGEMRIVLLIRE